MNARNINWTFYESVKVDKDAKRHPCEIDSIFHWAPMAGSSFHYDRQNTHSNVMAN